MENVLALIGLVLSCYILSCIIRPAGVIENILISFCIGTACIILWGYLLSQMDLLASLQHWAILGLCTAILAFIIAVITRSKFTLPSVISWQSLKAWYLDVFEESSLYVKLMLLFVALTVLFIGVLNLILVVTIAPHEWDSMTYHLPRMAHYLQQGNLNYFDANYWAQVVHPKNSTILLMYVFLVSGHNENLTQLVQYISYWVVVVSVYGLARKIGLAPVQSLFSALISALLIDVIMQATSTQNDLLIAAYFASAVYFLFVFRETKRPKYLALAAMGISLAVGTKASSLAVVPSVIVLSLALILAGERPKVWLRNLALLSSFVFIAICFFVLPSGYIENYRLYGNPLGNQDVSDMHTFDTQEIGYVARGGTYNILRYGFDFLSLDGLPPVDLVNAAQYFLRILPRYVLSVLNINLEATESTSFSPFEFDREPTGRYWGILGFGLVWPIVFLSLFQVLKNRDFFFLSLAAALFLIFLAFSGPYDASKGRYFASVVLFTVPPVGIWLVKRNRGVQLYLATIVLIGCVSALYIGLIKPTYLSATYPEQLKNKSLFSMDRLEQVTFNQARYYQAMVAFEHVVPEDAKVAVFLYPNAFEYPLYGKYLTRMILPINSFDRGLQTIPADAEFLLYVKGYPCALPNKDLHLGADWFLRELTDQNRECAAASAP